MSLGLQLLMMKKLLSCFSVRDYFCQRFYEHSQAILKLLMWLEIYVVLLSFVGNFDMFLNVDYIAGLLIASMF